MKIFRKITPLFLIMLIAVLLSACSGRRFEPEGWPGIVVDGDQAYVAYRSHVYFLNENGTETGRFPEEADAAITFFAQPEKVSETEMLIGSYASLFYNFNPATGNLNGEPWEVAQSRFIDDPLVVDDVIYISDTNRSLYALQQDFTPIWTQEFEQPLWSVPVLVDKVLYLTTLDGGLYAVSQRTGEILWQEDFEFAIVSAPAVGEDGMLYFGSFGSEVIAFDTISRRVAWRFATDGWVFGTVVLDAGVIYATDLNGNLYALDAEAGTELWQYQAGESLPSGVLVNNETIYVGTDDGKAVALMLDGTLVWERNVRTQINNEDARVLGQPVTMGEDLILFGIVDADVILVAYDRNGSLVWSFTPEK